MKCKLVNVVDNYHILITDAQYLGLKLFKKQFNGDVMVEKQIEQWFSNNQTVELSMDDFMEISGLTYFGEYQKHTDPKSHQHHIDTAVNMVKTNAKRKRSTPKSQTTPNKKGPKGPKRTGPKSKKRTLEQEIQIVLHSNNDTKRQKVDVIDSVPPKKPGQLSEKEMKERFIVTADNGNYMPALYTWLMGTYGGHMLYKAGFRKLYDIVIGGNGGIGIFTEQNARDFFLAPWEYHPDAVAQIKEVFAIIDPIHKKVTKALGGLPANNVLHGISSQDFYKIIVKGSGTTLSNGMKSTQSMRPEIVKLLKKIDSMELLRIADLKGKWRLDRMNPTRVTNMVKTYLHFDPSNLLTSIGTMLTEVLSVKYLSQVYSDFTPKMIQDSIGRMLSSEETLGTILKARAQIGDQKNEVLRHKMATSMAGVVLSGVGSAISAIELGKNIMDVSYQLNNKRIGKQSNISKAFVKTLLDSDHLYNLSHLLMVSAMESTACMTAINSGLVISTFAGPTPMTQYLGSLVLKQLTQEAARYAVGMEQSIYLKAATATAKSPIIAANIAQSALKGTYNMTKKIGTAMFQLAGRKRPRADEIDDAIKEHKKRLVMKDIESACKIQNKYWTNSHFRNTIMSSIAI